ncbi:MAG TPA: hypothetical protein VHP64_01115, partial [Candidatus Limnocylindria bacterium]|nr:hypothetical protein [Candidatus Limnocylindria bacterium]
LATSTSHVDATVRHDAPFYDFFQSITLEELSPEEVVALVEARARWDMDELLLARLEVVRARAHAAFHFSGGNPRLVLALCAFLRRSPTDELYTHVLRLLDEVTPYYQQRLGDISSQTGRILAEMAISGSALTPSEIARRCRMPINHVTANIAKLVAERFVRPVGRPDKRRRNYDLNDRLFRLWMQMREGHSARQRLRLLSEFFQRWYEGHPGEVRRTGADLAEASWHDPPGTTAQRCREHLATPEDLQGAMPERVELLLANSLYDHRRPARSEVAEDQVRRLRALSRSGNRALKAIAGIFLAIALEYLDLPQEALQVLRDADARELPPELRHAVLRNRLGMVARVSGPAKAIAEGRELIELEPELADLRAVLAAISVDAGDLPGARKLIEDLLMTEPCMRCVSVTIDQLVRAIVLTGQIDHLSSMLDLYEAHVAPAEILLRALKTLGTTQPARSKPERFLQAVAHWPSLAEVPGWLLWAAACTVSHTPGYALDAFPLTRSLVDRGSRVDLHTAHHVLLALLEAAARDAPAFEAMADWTATHVPGDVLSAAFVE